ncbi:MAG: hypothetical protein HY868_19320 [Chloroflexi bacterium]|nr:hypothetical protein [Chloroflexota bacterium]
MSLPATLAELESLDILHARTDTRGEYMFKHALMQERAYQSLLLRSRREIHRAVALAYEDLFAERLDEIAALLAQHYAEADDPEKLLAYALRAGKRAARLNAYAEARAHFAQALHALDALPRTRETARARVDTLIQSVAVAYASDSAQDNLARVIQAESLLREQIGEDEPTDRLRLAQVHYWFGRIHAYNNELPRAVDYLMRVLPVAAEFGDEALLAFPSSVIGRMMNIQGQFGAASVLLKQALAPLEKAESWSEWIATMGNLGMALAARGEYAAGLQSAQRALARAKETRDAIGTAEAYITLAVVYFMGNDNVNLCDAAACAIEWSLKSKSNSYAYAGHIARALAQTRLGQFMEATQTLDAARALDAALEQNRAFTDWYAAAEAEIALGASRVADAIELARQAVALAESLGGVFARGMAERVWALALAQQRAPRAEIESHLQASLRAFETGEAMLDSARTHAAWGRILRACGDHANAQTQFAQALAQFEASGLSQDAYQVRAWMNDAAM